MKRILRYCFLLIFGLVPLLGLSQNPIEDVNDLKKTANQFFKEGRYTEAFPLYAQLLSLDPKNPEMSYRFGVCNLYADKRDPEKPLKYLQTAAKTPGIEHDVYYFLAQAQHFTFRFPSAIRNYEAFKGKAGSREIKALDIDRKIEMCKNGMALLSQISDLFVLEKVEVNRSDFYRSYYKSDIGGVFLVKPDNFMSKQDKKAGENSLVFFPDNLNVVCFASYGKEGEYGKDIYFSYRGADRKWSEPTRLDFSINTPYDEEYPYLMPDGKTLYFSSKGHNSMGGFDIFRSVYDSVTHTWSKAENLDFAINTPYDDILFVPDVSGNYAYFSSDRASNEGKINVYKVRVDLRPRQQLEIDFQRFAGAEDDEGYLRLLGLIKDLASMEVNATVSMFDDNQTEEVEDSQRLAGFAKNTVNFDSISRSMQTKVEDKISSKAAIDRMVDTAFGILSKASQSLKNLKQLRTEQQKLHKGLPGETSLPVRKALADDLEKAAVRKEISLNQIKKIAGEAQQLATTATREEVAAKLQQIRDLIEPEDTLTDLVPLIRSEMQAVARSGKADPTSRILSDLTTEAILAVQPPSAKPEEMAGKEDETRQNEDTGKEEEDVLVADVNPDAIGVGDSIPPDPEENAHEMQENVRPAIVVDENLAKANKQRITDQVNRIEDRITQLRTRAKNEVLARQDYYLSLDKEYRDLEFKTLPADVRKREQLLDSMITAGKEYLVSYFVNQYIDTYLNEQMIEVDSLQADIFRTTDPVVFLDSVSPGNDLNGYEQLIDRLNSRLSALVKPEPVHEFILEQQKSNAQSARTVEDHVKTELANVSDLSKVIAALEADMGQLENSKVKKEFKKKQEAFQRERMAKSGDLQVNYNLYVSYRNIDLLLEAIQPVKSKISRRLTEIASDKPFPEPRQRNLSKTMLFGELEEMVNFEMGKEDERFALAFTQKELFDVQGADNPKFQRMTQLLGAVQPDSVTHGPAYRQLEAFRNQYSYFLKKSSPEEGSQSAAWDMQVKDLPSPYYLGAKNLTKLDRKFESMQKQLSKKQSYQELSTKQQALLSRIEDSLNAMRLRVDEQLRTTDTATDKKAAYTIELSLFEIRALSQKLKYFYDFRNLQLALQDVRNVPEKIPHVLIQDANYFVEQADRKMLEAKEMDLVGPRLNTMKEVVALQDSVLQRINQALSRTESGKNLVAAGEQNSEKPAETKKIPDQTPDPENVDEKIKELKGENKADAIPENLAANSPEDKPDVKPAGKPDVSNEDKTVAEPKVTSETKPSVKPDPKPVVTTEPKPVTVKETKMEGRQNPITGPEKETAGKPQPKAAEKPKPGTDIAAVTKTEPLVKDRVEAKKILSGLNPVQKTEQNNLENAIKTKEFPVSDEIYYTVQIGVYRTPRTSARLFNIHPLFEDRLPNELYRYCSGLYTNIREAVARRDEIRGLGVPDAFVVAYHKGKRIRVEDAARLIADKGVSLLSEKQLSAIVTVSKPALHAAFRVQLVAYRRAFTAEDIRRFEQIVKAPVEALVNDAGLNILVTAEETNFEKTRQFRQQIINAGITDAFITGWIEGRRVSLAEARNALIP